MHPLVLIIFPFSQNILTVDKCFHRKKRSYFFLNKILEIFKNKTIVEFYCWESKKKAQEKSSECDL